MYTLDRIFWMAAVGHFCKSHAHLTLRKNVFTAHQGAMNKKKTKKDGDEWSVLRSDRPKKSKFGPC
jgi:hypothetical protein